MPATAGIFFTPKKHKQPPPPRTLHSSMSTLNPAYQQDVTRSFLQQNVMQLINARLGVIEPGYVEVMLPFRNDLTQQHGFLHAGIISTIVDSACGYAALSLMPAGANVVTVEFKLNLLRPAVGQAFKASGQVKRSGAQLSVCYGEVHAISGQQEKCVATMLATMMQR